MQYSNIINKKEILKIFQLPDIKYTISSRNITSKMTIENYKKLYFSYIDLKNIESFFGFTNEEIPLYGGRFYDHTSKLTQNHIIELNENKIGISLTLTNHFFDEKSYKKSVSLLERYHKKSNTIVCENDELALKIKKDFPLYKIKASLIKNLNTVEKVASALTIYDYVVIPMEMNDNDDFLKSLPNKDRIILFGNANCAYNCENRICYKTVSNKFYKNKDSAILCSKSLEPRESLGFVYFDIKKFYNMGFNFFKLIPDGSIKDEIMYQKGLANNEKFVFYLFSMPKAGRTWLRFILANYINLKFNLNLNIEMNSMFSVVPNDGLSTTKGKGAYKLMDDKRFPLLIMSHKNLMNISPQGKNVIVLLRLVYDVMVSDYFQHKYFLNRFDGDIKEFIRLKKGALYQYCNFVNSLVKKENKILFITYESMHNNIESTMISFLRFLNISLDYPLLKKSIELSSFENMKKVEQKSGLIGKQSNTDDPNSFRVREGKIKGYHKYLDDNDIEYIKSFCEINLDEDAKQILSKFHISYQRGDE